MHSLPCVKQEAGLEAVNTALLRTLTP